MSKCMLAAVLSVLCVMETLLAVAFTIVFRLP